MATERASDPDDGFEIRFFESVHRRLPQDTQVVGILAELYTREGRVVEGLKLDRKLVRLQPDNPTVRYNLACSLALLGRKREAVESLRRAMVLGYDDFAWMMEDPDLESLRNTKHFLVLMAEFGLPVHY